MLLCFAVSAMQSVKADEYYYLTLKQGNVEESVTLSALKKITFQSGKLMATEISGLQRSYDLKTLNKMYFTSQPTAIEGVGNDASFALSYDPMAQVIRVSGAAVAMDLKIYSLSGALLRSVTVGDGNSTIGISSLSRGIYVVKVNGRTLKISR